MKVIELSNRTILGVISIELVGDYYKPWRIFHTDRDFYTPDVLNGQAEIPAGVKIAFMSTSPVVKVECAPAHSTLEFDIVIDREYYRTLFLQQGETTLIVDGLIHRNKKIEIFLSQQETVLLKSVKIDQDHTWDICDRPRKKILTYGSSITQCHAAESPSKTWPAIVSSELDMDLICLGLNGQCQFEPLLGQTVRDTPVDFISLCAGINSYLHSCYSNRTFQAVIIGFIKAIREKQPDVPIALSSPIYGDFREETKNLVGFTLNDMRKQIEHVADIFRRNGDDHIHYVNGLDIFGETHKNLLPDGLHPNAEGYKIMGSNYAKAFKSIMERSTA